VVGAYRLGAGSKEWLQLVTTATIADLQTTPGDNDYGVQSIVPAPADGNIVYMVFGDGYRYRSENIGDTQVRTSRRGEKSDC
jgi:hypothetical protein